MPSSFLTKLNLKTLIALCLLAVGILPLASSIAINFPSVASKLEQLSELERINELEEQVASLEKTIEHRKANLRTITALPGAAELFSDAQVRLLDPKKINKRMGFMLSRWLQPDSGVKAIVMVREGGEIVSNWVLGDKNNLVQIPFKGPAPAQMGKWLNEARNSPLNSTFVAGIKQEFFDVKSQHLHFPQVILAIPAKNKAGSYGGAIFMKISLASFVKDLPYDFIVTGAGEIIHRQEKEHSHSADGEHSHSYSPVSHEFPALLAVPPGKSHLILADQHGHKTAFVKIIADQHREHTIWLAHALETGDLEAWTNNFFLRFAFILALLLVLVVFLAMFLANKTGQMHKQLVTGLNGLIQNKEPLQLDWKWPAEVNELDQELETLSRTLIESDENLRQSERFLKNVLHGIQDGIIVYDHDYTMLEVNKCIEEWYKDQLPLVGKKCYEVFHDRDAPCADCPGRLAIEQGTLQRMEMPWKVTGDQQKWLEVFAYPVRDEAGDVIQVVEFIRDITARKEAEEERDNLANQLAFSQKMEAVGTLAGGVAHDFNNILSAINGYAEMCLAKLEPDHPLQSKIAIILESGQRASALTQQLLAFSRKQIIRPQNVDVNRTLTNTRKMLTRILGEDIEMSLSPDPNLWPIHADQTQFEQVIINLAVNARDAMPQGGKLSFETKNVTLDEPYLEKHYEVAAGDYVLMAVSDNGQGMNKETRAKIFDPFFTTKESGKGTGLGLATVYGIIKQNKGEIMVYSEPGQGTTFKIYLPRLVDDVAVAEERAEEEELLRGTETIFLVEDDEVVRSMSVEILTSLGYSVLEAADGVEALQACKRYHGTIDLLLTDVVMPRMNGSELAKKVLESRPEIKVLFMSGYTDEAIVKHGILQDDVLFLQKPITPKNLSKALRQALEGDS